jgi:uncharacterized protein (DUF2141 family)
MTRATRRRFLCAAAAGLAVLGGCSSTPATGTADVSVANLTTRPRRVSVRIFDEDDALVWKQQVSLPARTSETAPETYTTNALQSVRSGHRFTVDAETDSGASRRGTLSIDCLADEQYTDAVTVRVVDNAGSPAIEITESNC